MPTDNCSSHHSSKKFSFAVDTETIIKPHTWFRYIEQLTVRYAASGDTSTTQLLHQTLREHFRKWGREMVGAAGTRTLL